MARREKPAGGLAEEERLALVRLEQPEREPDERRLAAAVRPGDRDELDPARYAKSTESTGWPPVGEGDAAQLDRGGEPYRPRIREPPAARPGSRASRRSSRSPAARLASREPLERVERRDLHAGLARDRLARARGRRAARRRRSWPRTRAPRRRLRSRSLGAGSASGSIPVTPTWLEPVPLGEVAEGLVARDEHRRSQSASPAGTRRRAPAAGSTEPGGGVIGSSRRPSRSTIWA